MNVVICGKGNKLSLYIRQKSRKKRICRQSDYPQIYKLFLLMCIVGPIGNFYL